MLNLGKVSDAHSIVIISQILEMNGSRDEMMKLKCHIDGILTAYVRHYFQFNGSLLSLHFKFNGIDAATKNISNNCCSNEEYRNHLQKPCFIAVGSPDRGLVSVPKTIEVVKILSPQGLF